MSIPTPTARKEKCEENFLKVNLIKKIFFWYCEKVIINSILSIKLILFAFGIV